MRKILLTIILAISVVFVFAQKDVTTFLGIPVDGFRSEMRQKLIAKGFTPRKTANGEFFEGEFNGTDVNIYIATNNNKVWRIMVCDANTISEANIKVRFNRLVTQFENNKRYTNLDQYTISDDEHISYEMIVNNKNYDALFYQLPKDTIGLQAQVKQELLTKYTQEQLDNPTEEITSDAQAIAWRIFMDVTSKKPVWFRIMEKYGEYYISIFYDNEYNHANGEDL